MRTVLALVFRLSDAPFHIIAIRQEKPDKDVQLTRFPCEFHNRTINPRDYHAGDETAVWQ